MIFLKCVVLSGIFPDIPERMPEATCSGDGMLPWLRLILCFQIERGVGYMRNRVLALLLCISLGAGAVPSLAAESEKTASPAATVEAGKSSGTEQAASSVAAAVEAAESSVTETGETEQAASSVAAAVEAAESSVTETGETEQAASSVAAAAETAESSVTETGETEQAVSSAAAALDAWELPDSEAADTASEPPAAESDDGDLIYIEVEDVAEAIKEIDETAVQLLEKLEHVDKQQLMENLIALQALLQSEEFRTIINYQEIKDLIQEMLASVIDFAKTDEELCIEVLDKLGIPRVLGTVIMEGLAISSLSGDVVRNMSIDEFYKQLELLNSVISKVIQENDVLKAVSSLGLDGGA